MIWRDAVTVRNKHLMLLDRASAALARFELVLSSAAMILLLALNGYAIIGRHLLGNYPSWIIEVTETLLVTIVFLGGAWLYRARRHIAVTVLVDGVLRNTWLRRVLVVAGELVVLAFALVTLWQAAKYQPILFARQTPVLGLPANIVSAAVPVAYLSIAISSLCHLRRLGPRAA
jgi:TRAP-type C4-dicarboxylate transport system permease small subunit